MKKWMAMLLILTMLLGCMPMQALAQEQEADTAVQELAANTELSAEEGTPDITPPVLSDISLSRKTVQAPEPITVTVNASDDVSGIDSIWVFFVCEETEELLAVEMEGKNHKDEWYGTLNIDQYVQSGTFVVRSVELIDQAGNKIHYWRDPSFVTDGNRELPDTLKTLQFVVDDMDTNDRVPPVLNGIRIAAESVTAPGTIEVIVDASDNYSGINYGGAFFTCKETGQMLHAGLDRTYWNEEANKYLPYIDGKLHGRIELDKYTVPGTFSLESVHLFDIAMNQVLYTVEPEDLPYEAAMPESMKSLCFTVTDSLMPDNAPPVLKKMTLSETSVKAPSEVEILMEATDDVSGAMYAYIRFHCDTTGKNLEVTLEGGEWEDEEWVPYSDGKLRGTLEIDQYVASGRFVIAYINISDVAGNEIEYDRDDFSRPDFPENIKALELKVGSLDEETTPTSGSCGENLTWVFDEDTGTLTISGTGAMTEWETMNYPWYGFEEQIQTVIVESGVTTIESKTFNGYANLKRIDIADSVWKIGDFAFYGCFRLEEIAFPSGLTEIGAYAFDNCCAISTIRLSEKIKSIGEYAFYDCSGLSEIFFDGNAPESIGEEAFHGTTVTIYYPANHSTWTSDVMQDYGGTVTWVPYSNTAADTVPIYRLYNPNTYGHLLVSDEGEKTILLKAGWELDGIAWNAPREGSPVYRMYNPFDDWHTYTTSAGERDEMITQGWTLDGPVSCSAAEENGRPVYRLFNPYVQTNFHHFTADVSELEFLVSLGWVAEGVAWFALS